MVKAGNENHPGQVNHQILLLVASMKLGFLDDSPMSQLIHRKNVARNCTYFRDYVKDKQINKYTVFLLVFADTVSIMYYLLLLSLNMWHLFF